MPKALLRERGPETAHPYHPPCQKRRPIGLRTLKLNLNLNLKPKQLGMPSHDKLHTTRRATGHCGTHVAIPMGMWLDCTLLVPGAHHGAQG